MDLCVKKSPHHICSQVITPFYRWLQYEKQYEKSGHICHIWSQAVKLVTLKVKDLKNDGLDGYFGSMDILMVSQFDGRWNFSRIYCQNGTLHHLLTCWLRGR